MFPYEFYASDSAWVPPLRMTAFDTFRPNKNPFYQYGSMELYLAVRNNKVVGRIAAIENPRHNDTHGENMAFFGFFEAQDETAAQALLEITEHTARQKGRLAIRGPVNPTMDEGAGFQINAFDTTPYLMTPHSPEAYLGYMEMFGYKKTKDLYAWRYISLGGMGERLSRLAERVKKRYAVTVRPADLKNYKSEVALLRQLYNKAWEKNWGFVKMTEAELDQLANDLKLILDPNIALFAEYEGEVVCLAIALPDINLVLKRMGGRLLPFGFMHLLNRKKIINRARLPILGVLPEYRQRGFELVMIDEIAKRGQATYHEAECSWILEDNDPMNKGIAATGASLYKTYRIFQKAL
ncbi:MAG: N-acetyltransferase [Trueperaceae bacterium]|nr:N-acetyltransferase [Trueperaceae bacterium]